MKRKITQFIQDEVGDWVAELSCGHTRHVRHRPPWQNRSWVLSMDRRTAMLGEELDCGLCARENENKK